jgi:hypothetical protein
MVFLLMILMVNNMDKKLQYEYLKQFVNRYRTNKTYSPMMLRVFEILLSDLESEIISQYKANQSNVFKKGN